jgi:hypothetical protein
VLGSGAGRVCHFDRDERLASSGASREQLAAAVAEALAGAPCLLVAVELVEGGSFPLTAFQQVVVYASEPGSQAALRTRLEGLSCPLHFMELALPALLELPQTLQAQPSPDRHARVQEHRRQAVGAAGAGAGAGPVSRVQHPARPAAPAGQENVSADWPVIISSDHSRPIRCEGNLLLSARLPCY